MATDKTVAKETVRALETICFDRDLSKELVAEMLGDHRTHQQRFMGLVVAYLKAAAVAAEKGQYDARNEAAAQFALRVKESGVLDDVYFPVI